MKVTATAERQVRVFVNMGLDEDEAKALLDSLAQARSLPIGSMARTVAEELRFAVLAAFDKAQ